MFYKLAMVFTYCHNSATFAKTPYLTMRYHQDLVGTKEDPGSDVGVCECFEKDCSGWDMALSCLFTLFTMSLPVLFTMYCVVSALVGFYKGRARKKEQELLTV